MMKAFVFAFLFFTTSANAQTFSRYLVRFKDKATNPYSLANPSQYLSQRAIDRRTKYSIALDSTDLPVTSRYIDSIRLAGNVTILNVSKWLNQVSIQTTDATALAKINSFPFVQSSSPIASRLATGRSKGTKEHLQKKKASQNKKAFNPATDYYNYGSSYAQIHIHNGEALHNIGLRGQGMIIGILDAGFFQYTSLKAFDSVNKNGQVLGVYDFVAKDNSVVEDNTHGMECFSVIAANIPGQFVGAAPKSAFYLFRSEDAGSEYPIEEHNWVCAAERLDSAGGDVISSSLGYNTFDNSLFDHTYAQLDGNTTMAAIGADLAAKKGILVVNAAGNEGDNDWGKLTTPADGDSVLAVAAVNTSGVAALFSSRGPSSDRQVKPDVASVGVGSVIQGPANNVTTNNGTSFSCPNIAGLATCLWQGFPEFNNIKILQAMRQAGSRYTTPNDSVGYGIPNMQKAVLVLLKDFSTATVSSISACKNIIAWTSKDAAGMRYEIERKAPGETGYSKVGEVEAISKDFSTQNYQFADSLLNVQAGSISYRIKQVIDTSIAVTAGADYIDTVTINLAATCTTTPVTNVPVDNDEFVLLPNPTTNKISLRIRTAYAIPQLNLRIADNMGEVLTIKKTAKSSGISIIDLPISQLPKAKYYLLIHAGEKQLAVREFVKL